MATSYRSLRNYENLQKVIFGGVGIYGIPAIRPTCTACDNWISFNFAKGCEEPQLHGVHFFIDDYQFNRVWAQPDTYTPMLRRFSAVCTPDFSTYTDFPVAIQIYNHYRKHWLGAYWQAHGMTVIPTISWSDHKSYRWCFDGEPTGSCVAVSSVGTQVNRTACARFLDGYHEMLRRLHPSQVIMYGKCPDDCRVPGVQIIEVKAFQQKWRDDAAGTAPYPLPQPPMDAGGL